MNIQAVREGLAANLQANLENIQISAYVLGNPTTPSLHIMPAQSELTVAMQRGHEERDFLIQVMTGLATDKGAQQKLDEFMSEDKITAAVLTDPTLGGVVDDCSVLGDSGYQIFSRDGQPPVLGCEWRVRVYG